MPIVDARDLFDHAAAAGYRLPLVAPRDLHDACTWMREAERIASPMVLDVSDLPDRPEEWDIALPAVEAFASRSPVPIVLHRAGIKSEDDLAKAIRLGCGAVTPAAAVARNVVAMAETLGLATLGLATGRAEPFADPAGTPAGQPADWEGRGKAGPALAACRLPQPVEHVVMFNPEGLSDAGVREMLRIGTDMLGAIPGVRAVRTGRALADDARFSLCWLVLFASEHVVAHYRDHPTHIAFADHHFRPFAGDRMTIDFRLG